MDIKTKYITPPRSNLCLVKMTSSCILVNCPVNLVGESRFYLLCPTVPLHELTNNNIIQKIIFFQGYYISD